MCFDNVTSISRVVRLFCYRVIIICSCCYAEHSHQRNVNNYHLHVLLMFEALQSLYINRLGLIDSTLQSHIYTDLLCSIHHHLKYCCVTESATNQSETNKAIRTLTIQGLDYLDTRTEFWQQQKPMYSRKRDRKMRENVRGQTTGVDRTKDPIPWVLKNLEEIDEGQYFVSVRDFSDQIGQV